MTTTFFSLTLLTNGERGGRKEEKKIFPCFFSLSFLQTTTTTIRTTVM
jgi:hypothetical protein